MLPLPLERRADWPQAWLAAGPQHPYKTLVPRHAWTRWGRGNPNLKRLCRPDAQVAKAAGVHESLGPVRAFSPHAPEAGRTPRSARRGCSD